jgi:hypothetical protein
MKRILASLIAAGGLALMASSPALAVNPLCGHSYAILMTGANPTINDQTGASGNPGALTNAVGVGEITFGPAFGTGCSPNTGTLIWNDGDTQSAGDPGVFTGPAHCYDNFGLLNAFAAQNGIPCFDGANHMSGITVTNPGPFGNGSQDLKFTAVQVWTNGLSAASTQSFDFTVQTTGGGATALGGSVSPAASVTRDVTRPILTLTMQKQTVPCGNAFGVAPFVGNAFFSESTFGANGTDPVSSTIAASGNGSYEGGYDATVGAMQIFNATQAGGSLSLNANNTVQKNAGANPGTNDCSFDLTPGNNCTAFINAHCTTAATGANGVGPYTGCTGAGTGTNDCSPEPATASFADCTDNTVTVFTSSGSSCSLVTTNPGIGFAQSSAVWGPTDRNSYFTNTALVSGAQAALGGASGFTSGVGSIGAGLTLAQTPTGALRTSNTVAKALLNGQSDIINLVNTTPADCNITATLGGVTTDGNCSLTITNASTDSPGNTVENVGSPLPPPGGAPVVTCTCIGPEDNSGGCAPGSDCSIVGGPLTISSSNCPITAGGTGEAFSCNN